MSRPLTFSHLSAETFETGQKGAGRKGPRYREAISCLPCRNRKVRCSRELPCRQCQDRSHECSYTKPPRKRTAAPPSRPDPAISLPTPSDRYSGASAPITPHLQPGWIMPADTPRLGLRSSAASSPKLAHVAGPEEVKKRPDELKYPSPPDSVVTNAVPVEATFAGSNFGSRLLGPTHWMAPCQEMMVVKAMLDGSDGFVTNRKAFTQLMDMARSANKLPPAFIRHPSGLDATYLRHVLEDCSDRHETRQWAQHFFTGWGRIYQIVDAATLSDDMGDIYNTADMDNAHEKPDGTASLLRVLMVVAVAMQRSEQHRLQGRRLGKCVEDFLYATSGSREPCIGLVQALLLLLVLKTIAASDMDSMSGSMGVQGLTSQVVLAVGLHRDPGLFPGLSTYQRDSRKRMWACYLRLSLDYSIRTGSPLPIHLEDTDCPLPAATRISTPDVLRQCPPSSLCYPDPVVEQADAIFGLEAAKLARILVPIQRALCSPSPKASQCDLSMEDINSTLGSFIADVPPSLKLDGASKTPIDVILVLQRSILSINMHSISLMVALRNVICECPDPSQKAQLMEVWDHAISILDMLQNLLQLGDQGGPEAAAAAEITYQLLWPDAVRAALYACILVSRMCCLDSGRMLRSGGARNTIATICQSLLSMPLSFLCRFWESKFHLGPVATKVSLLLAVALTVTSNLDASADAAARDWTRESKEKFMQVGVTVVNEWVAGMKNAFETRLRENRAASTGMALLSPLHNVLPLTALSALNSTPHGDTPTQLSPSSVSPSLVTGGWLGDFDFNFSGIFGQGFEFDSVESLMMEGMGGYGHEVSLSPMTHTSGLEEFL